MKHFIADTTIFIDHLRQNPTATDFLKKYSPSFSTVSKAELIEGTRNKNELKTVDKLCSGFSENKINQAVTTLAIDLMEKHYLSHGLLFLDALIAATAITENLTLVTSNAKHFSFLPNLDLKNWKDFE